MADYVVGVTDGYHSIAFADGLEPAERRPFSIASPSALTRAEASLPTAAPALAEMPRGSITNTTA
ncbi:MAG: hypothetical protein AAGU21_17160 [Solidesulfovibrio sp.]|uniref:hypothetical protein n=1 Tax=Solidesulfovibrio sp. TaxID=2910990 RepID=UPI002B1FD229|nr:hypothetical protein [Solidesulfovibrio sp.]MEA4855731.1 hypothetical protein [Solidesulfovibrio sp.]